MIKTLRVFFIFDGFSKKGEGGGGRGEGYWSSKQCGDFSIF